MLETVTLRNLALIDSLELEFGPGMNVITGPTGSGKSLLLRGLKLALGERADYDLLPDAADRSVASAFFNPPGEVQLPPGVETAAELSTRRVLKASRQSPGYLNGERVRLSQLREVRRRLLDFHGQHENQNVFDSNYPREVLDEYGAYEDVVADYKSCYEEFNEVCEKLNKLKKKRENAERQREFLNYQLEELDEFSPEENEWAEIEERRRQMENHEDADRWFREALGLLEGESGLTAEFKKVEQQLESLSEVTGEFESWVDETREIGVRLEELRRQLREQREEVSYSEKEYNDLLDRRGRWMELARKHDVPPEALYSHYRSLKSELEELDQLESQIEKLRSQSDQLEEKLRKRAEKLTGDRRETAEKLTEEVNRRFDDLDLEKALFEVRVTEDEFGPSGRDRVDWLFTSHDSQEPDLLERRISGGEISRVLLAIKAALAAADTTPVLIFDELDTGISGEEARSVGELLSELSEFHQVICITHLPLVSVYADHHLLVERVDREEEVEVRSELLGRDRRLDELCRLLSGDRDSPVSRRQAEELLEEVKAGE